MDADAKFKLIDETYKNPATTGGRDRLYARLKDQGISRKEIIDYLKNNEVQQIHQPRPKRETVKRIIATAPRKMMSVDLFDMEEFKGLNNGDRYCLVCIDMFAKWVELRACKTKDAKSVAKAMDSVLERFGAIATVLSDNGGEFKGAFETLLKKKGINIVHSQPYAPWSNGLAERTVRQVKSIIYKHMTLFKTKKWNDILEAIQANINSSPSDTTGFTPADAMTGKHNAEILKAIQDNAIVHDEVKEFNVGQTVRVLLTAFPAERRDKFRKHIKANWTETIFEVYEKQPGDEFKQSRYRLVNLSTNRKLKKLFYGFQMMAVDPEKIIKNEDKRPVYNPAIFNQEEHLHKLHEDRKGAVRPEKKQEEPKGPRKQRTQKPSAKLVDAVAHS